MPGIESVEFMERRCQLMQQLPPKSVVLLPGYGLRYASGPVFHDFQQATNMLYYCGFDEPDSLLVILTLEGNTLPQAILFCQDENPPNVTFHGTNIGPKRAVEHFGIQEAYPSSNLVNFLQTKIAPLLYNATLYLDVDGNTSKAILTPVVSDLIQKMTKGNFKDINIITHKQRSVKSPSELNLLRKAGQAGAAGILAAIRGTAPHLEESDLKNILEFTVRQYRGVEGLSYAPVIASGENALVLHYVKNRHLLEAGQMVLMDAGALYHHYRSDISRTWPINGKFTKPQKEIYQAVLNVHQACIRVSL